MLKSLGTKLKRARSSLGVSLQSVATPAGISAAYLHKLEQGSIETPSPHVLRRVSGELGLPYLELMVLAGYLGAEQIEGQWTAPQNEEYIAAGRDLSETEQTAVVAFIGYLKGQR